MDLDRRRRWRTGEEGKLLKMCGATRGEEGEGEAWLLGPQGPHAGFQCRQPVDDRMLEHSASGCMLPCIDLVGGVRCFVGPTPEARIPARVLAGEGLVAWPALTLPPPPPPLFSQPSENSEMLAAKPADFAWKRGYGW